MLGIEHLYLSGTVRMHTLMVEELTFHKKDRFPKSWVVLG